MTKVDYRKKEAVIIDLQKAFIEDRSQTVEQIIRSSGHTMGTILKYFGSVHTAFCAAKIDVTKYIPDQDILDEFLRVYNELGKLPTEKDLGSMSKYSGPLFIRRFGSIDCMAEKCGLMVVRKLKQTKEDLLEELKRVCIELGRAPTFLEVQNMSKYSSSTYIRTFGSFANALSTVGYTANTNKKVEQTCSVCGLITTSLVAHLTSAHPEELQRQEQLVIGLFKSGLSARKIAVREDVVFKGATSVNKVVGKYLSKEEIEQLRRAKIGKQLKDDYARGKYDWVKQENSERNATEEARTKNSEGLRKAYADGTRTSWNEGLSKENSEIIALAAEKQREKALELHQNGEVTKSVGPESVRWNENREQVARRYRLGLDFTREDKRNIKQRAGYKCQKCGITQEELEEKGLTLECDHIIPIVKNGSNDWVENGQVLCPDCHRNKT